MLHFTKIRPIGAQLFRADGHTDRHDDTLYETTPLV